MDIQRLKDGLPTTAFAFRGYNVTNLGRSNELLAHDVYGSLVADSLRRASDVCADVVGRRVDLVARVRDQVETDLTTYDEAIALILAMEQAQVELLKEFYGIELRSAAALFGYSLGEIAAVSMAGIMDIFDAMKVPLHLAADSVALAENVTLGILFSRGVELPANLVERLCLRVSQQGQGTVGISAQLSPNSLLVMGQGDGLDRLRRALRDATETKINLRKNSQPFPPLHTPITWQRQIPDRAAVLMETLPGGFRAPRPPVLSLVTGKANYDDHNARSILRQWVDHPQRLWEIVYETLRSGIETVVHVGPEPNIIPATYKRLRDNVEIETRGRIGMRALTAVVDHPWIKRMLPERTALLRAPLVAQVVLEDWLLEQDPASSHRPA